MLCMSDLHILCASCVVGLCVYVCISVYVCGADGGESERFFIEVTCRGKGRKNKGKGNLPERQSLIL